MHLHVYMPSFPTFPSLRFRPNHRKMTDADKKVVRKIDESLQTIVDKTEQFLDLLDGTAGALELFGDVMSMQW